MYYNSCKEFVGNIYDDEKHEYIPRNYGEEHLTNSIWFNPNCSLKDACLSSLANDYYCYPFEVDFSSDNEKANKLVREFVKEHTRNLIDQDFNISEETMVALMNTLYWKNAWGDDDLLFTSNPFEFKNSDNTITSTKFLHGNYVPMDIYETIDYSYAYALTNNGYKIKFYYLEYLIRLNH